MRKALIALIVCGAIVSAFTVTSIASAKTEHPDRLWAVGSNGIVQSRETGDDGTITIEHYNSDTNHVVQFTHNKDTKELEHWNLYNTIDGNKP